MATGISEYITRLRSATVAERGDAELLAAFVRERDEAAFTELVHRHGPGVLAEARRVLFDPSETDDVFQATFLVLARQAATIVDPARLGGWLRGVARRVARTARRRAAKRVAHERPLEASPEPATEPAPPSADLRTVLDEELNRLPRTYRAVVIACDVEGLSRRAAAERFGLPESTLSNRLARARALLGRRLLRRGVALGAGLAVAAPVSAVPPRLIALTRTRIAADSVPPEIAFLATEASKNMIRFHSVPVVLALAAAAALAFPLGVPRPEGATVRAAPVPAQGIPVEPPDPEPKQGHYVYAAGYSRNGTLLALAQPKTYKGEGEHKVLLFDTRTWKPVHKLTGPTDYCFAVTFAADGKTLFASCRDGKVYTWDTKTGTPGPTLDAKAGSCDEIALSPDGTILATGHYDNGKKPRANAIHLWDAATLKPLRVIGPDETMSTYFLTFTPDGKSLAVGYNNERTGEKDFSGVIEWDVTTGKEVKRYDTVRITPGARPIVEQVAYTPDGKWMVVGGGEAVPHPSGGCNPSGYLWLYDRATGKVEKTLIDRRIGYVSKLVLSPRGGKLYVATNSLPREVMENGQTRTKTFGELQCWDTGKWELQWTRESEMMHHWALVASPDGRRLGASNTSGFRFSDTTTGAAKGGLVKTGSGD
jgi:RNA polymerase sigma factor (sigma-70 family)